MAEFKYILKCFLISILFVAVLQIKVNATTAEEVAHQWIQSSTVGKYIQQVAEGGVLLGRNTVLQLNQFISRNFGNRTEDTSSQASRLNIELKRAHSNK